MTVTPWWKAMKIRQEILGASGQIDDVQMSLFAAVHGASAARPPYADANYYGDITQPTERLVDLLTEIAVRIGGGDDYLKARAVTRLDQGMGGGKSHACIGAFHLAANPEALLGTELGRWPRAQSPRLVNRWPRICVARTSWFCPVTT
jgi:predicted AAA+ superfamily ATPase